MMALGKRPLRRSRRKRNRTTDCHPLPRRCEFHLQLLSIFAQGFRFRKSACRKYDPTYPGTKLTFHRVILAIGHDPELLILDEPMSGLGPNCQRRFLGRCASDVEQSTIYREPSIGMSAGRSSLTQIDAVRLRKIWRSCYADAEAKLSGNQAITLGNSRLLGSVENFDHTRK